MYDEFPLIGSIIHVKGISLEENYPYTDETKPKGEICIYTSDSKVKIYGSDNNYPEFNVRMENEVLYTFRYDKNNKTLNANIIVFNDFISLAGYRFYDFVNNKYDSGIGIYTLDNNILSVDKRLIIYDNYTLESFLSQPFFIFISQYIIGTECSFTERNIWVELTFFKNNKVNFLLVPPSSQAVSKVFCYEDFPPISPLGFTLTGLMMDLAVWTILASQSYRPTITLYTRVPKVSSAIQFYHPSSLFDFIVSNQYIFDFIIRLAEPITSFRFGEYNLMWSVSNIEDESILDNNDSEYEKLLPSYCMMCKQTNFLVLEGNFFAKIADPDRLLILYGNGEHMDLCSTMNMKGIKYHSATNDLYPIIIGVLPTYFLNTHRYVIYKSFTIEKDVNITLKCSNDGYKILSTNQEQTYTTLFVDGIGDIKPLTITNSLNFNSVLVNSKSVGAKIHKKIPFNIYKDNRTLSVLSVYDNLIEWITNLNVNKNIYFDSFNSDNLEYVEQGMSKTLIPFTISVDVNYIDIYNFISMLIYKFAKDETLNMTVKIPFLISLIDVGDDFDKLVSISSPTELSLTYFKSQANCSNELDEFYISTNNIPLNSMFGKLRNVSLHNENVNIVQVLGIIPLDIKITLDISQQSVNKHCLSYSKTKIRLPLVYNERLNLTPLCVKETIPPSQINLTTYSIKSVKIDPDISNIEFPLSITTNGKITYSRVFTTDYNIPNIWFHNDRYIFNYEVYNDENEQLRKRLNIYTIIQLDENDNLNHKLIHTLDDIRDVPYIEKKYIGTIDLD